MPGCRGRCSGEAEGCRPDIGVAGRWGWLPRLPGSAGIPGPGAVRGSRVRGGRGEEPAPRVAVGVLRSQLVRLPACQEEWRQGDAHEGRQGRP